MTNNKNTSSQLTWGEALLVTIYTMLVVGAIVMVLIFGAWIISHLSGVFTL